MSEIKDQKEQEQHVPLILIDPGHGGRDPGAVGGDVREADINLEVAYALALRLREEGLLVASTRWKDLAVTLAQRVKKEQEVKPDLYLSLHCNSAFMNSTAEGIEVWTSPGDTGADPAATEIFMAMSRAFPGRKLRTDYSDSDPDKEERFHVLVRTRAPAVLVEMGFVSNEFERAWLQDPMTHWDLAAAMTAGIKTWIEKRPVGDVWPESAGPLGLSMKMHGGRDGLD